MTAWVSHFRRREENAAERAELRRFRRLITVLPDHELSSILADYEFMAALEPNSHFALNRDACQEELCRRAECPGRRSSVSEPSLDISAFEAAVADLNARAPAQLLADDPQHT